MRPIIPVLMIMAVMAMVGAIIFTTLMVPPIRRLSNYHPVDITFQDIQLSKRFVAIKSCNNCQATLDTGLPYCDELATQIALLSPDHCLDNTGPCPEARSICRNADGCCQSWNCRYVDNYIPPQETCHQYCKIFIDNNLCHLDNYLRYIALITKIYFNPQVAKDIVIHSEMILDTEENYQQFRQQYLNATLTAYYHQNDPYNLIDNRELNGEEKTFIILSAICWTVMITSLASIMVMSRNSGCCS